MTTDEPAPPRTGWAAGARLGATLAPATFGLAVTFGALATGTGWSLAAAVGSSLLIFSGSAQFALLTALAAGSGTPVAVGAAGLINARFLPMGAAVAGSLKGSRWRRALEGQAVVDTSWVGAYSGEGRFDREKLLGATAVQWPAWIGGTLLGALLAPSPDLVERLGLDVVFPGFYLLLLLETLGGAAGTRRVALLAALITAALLLVAPAGLALLGAGAAALLVLRRPA